MAVIAIPLCILLQELLRFGECFIVNDLQVWKMPNPFFSFCEGSLLLVGFASHWVTYVLAFPPRPPADIFPIAQKACNELMVPVWRR
jgi:hypothetical protein